MYMQRSNVIVSLGVHLKPAAHDFIGLRQLEPYVRTMGEIADFVGKTLNFYDRDAKAALSIWIYQTSQSQFPIQH